MNGEVDASAIDATVLDLRLEREPHLRDQIRIIESLGPSPIPPYVVGKHVPVQLHQALRQVLTHMHEDAQGRAILQQGQVGVFAVVTDADYDRTREMLARAGIVVLWLTDEKTNRN